MTKQGKQKAYWANLCQKAKASGGVVKKYAKGQLKAEKLAIGRQFQMGPLPLAPSGPMQGFAQYHPQCQTTFQPQCQPLYQPMYQPQYSQQFLSSIPQYFGMPQYQPAYQVPLHSVFQTPVESQYVVPPKNAWPVIDHQPQQPGEALDTKVQALQKETISLDAKIEQFNLMRQEIEEQHARREVKIVREKKEDGHRRRSPVLSEREVTRETRPEVKLSRSGIKLRRRPERYRGRRRSRSPVRVDRRRSGHGERTHRDVRDRDNRRNENQEKPKQSAGPSELVHQVSKLELGEGNTVRPEVSRSGERAGKAIQMGVACNFGQSLELSSDLDMVKDKDGNEWSF